MSRKSFDQQIRTGSNGVITIGTLYDGPYQSFIVYLPDKAELVFNIYNTANAGSWVQRMSTAEAERHADELWYKSYLQAVTLGKGWKTLEWKSLGAGEYESTDPSIWIM